MNRRNLRIAVIETKYEILKLFRSTAFIVPTLGFPILFYLFFGVAFGHRNAAGQSPVGIYLIATYGAFGVIGAAFSSLGAAVAIERGQGLLQIKKATPMPFFAYLASKLAAAMLFGAIIVLLLFAAGAVFSGAAFSPAQWIVLFATLVAGTIPFALFGLTIGYLATADGVIAVINLIFLPMAFASGLWIPIQALPRGLQSVAEYLPAYHLGQLALDIIDAPSLGSASSHVVALAGFTLVFLTTAIAAYRRDRRLNHA